MVKKNSFSPTPFLISFFLIGFFLFLGFFLISYPSSRKSQKKGFFNSLPTPAQYPKNFTNQPPPDITAKSIIIKDVDSGVILYEKDSWLAVPPASTTKIMSALISLENYQLDEVIEISDSLDVEGQKMKLIPKERIKVKDLLYGLLIASANDAAVVLANNFPGGESGFVWAMNQKAEEIGLRNTHFTNPIGLDDPDHYSTAYDLAKLASYAMKNKEFALIVGTKEIVVSDVDEKIFHPLSNINYLIGKIPGVKGVKTGWTQAAGECLVTFVEKEGKKIIIVVLGSNDRFGETERLINWVFANFQWEDFTHLK